MEQGYVLVQTKVGTAERVARGIRDADGVATIDVVTGAFDIVARVYGPTLAAAQTDVMARLAADLEATRALFCPVVPEQIEAKRTEPTLAGVGAWGS